MEEYHDHNIILIEQKLREKLFKTKYNKRFMKFKIYSSWWSNCKDKRLSYRRFLQIAWILEESPTILLSEESSEEEIEKFLELCDSGEKITMFIKITKNVLRNIFKEKKIKKTTFLENIVDERLDISRKTITRVLNQEEYLEFSLKTFLIILEGLKLEYSKFFKKIYEVMTNESYN